MRATPLFYLPKNNTKTMRKHINIHDILDVLEHNSFSNQKQIDLLQIINYTLFEKRYPQDICGILERKIQLLQQEQEIQQPETNTNIACVKVRSVAILELLSEMNVGTAHNDRTKISKLIAFLTGSSHNRIYNEIKKGICFTNYHSKDIDEINKIFTELSISISIHKDKHY